jgi:hypothetical protein
LYFCGSCEERLIVAPLVGPAQNSFQLLVLKIPSSLKSRMADKGQFSRLAMPSLRLSRFNYLPLIRGIELYYHTLFFSISVHTFSFLLKTIDSPNLASTPKVVFACGESLQKNFLSALLLASAFLEDNGKYSYLF